MPKKSCCPKKDCCPDPCACIKIDTCPPDCCPKKKDPCCDPCWNSCCDPCCQPCCPPCPPVVDDCLAKEILCLFKQAGFCDASLIGLPSCNDCVLTLTHSLGNCLPCLKINGLPTKSIIANNAFYTAEVSNCKFLNLYQITLPDVAGSCGCKSSTEVYTEALVRLGISVDSNSSNWKTTCPTVVTVYSKAIGMNPCEFAKKQIAAIKAVQKHFFDCC